MQIYVSDILRCVMAYVRKQVCSSTSVRNWGSYGNDKVAVDSETHNCYKIF
jgi:hypothetical protein